MAPNGETIAAVNDIAEWCEKKADEFAKSASQQFWLIVLAIVVGLGMILMLPPLIGQIDITTSKWFDRKPQTAVLKDAEKSVLELGKQVEDSNKRLLKWALQRDEINKQLKSHIRNSVALLSRAEKLLSAPFTFGAHVEISKERSTVIYAQAVQNDRVLYAAGRDRSLRTNKMTILRSRRDRNWSSVHPVGTDGKRISGIVWAMAVGKNGQMFAAGNENTRSIRFMSIMRSARGRRWLAVHPVNIQNNRITGTIFALTITNKGDLIAAGYEQSRRGLQMAVFRSSDGRSWSPIHPLDGDNQRLAGTIYSLAIGKKGALYAAGRITGKSRRGSWATTLRLAGDSNNWETFYPPDSAGKRTKGTIYALTVLNNGDIIAAGREGKVFTGTIATFLSSNGKSWVPTHPASPKGTRIRGSVRSLVTMPNNRIVGVGRSRFGNMLVYSNDGRTWVEMSAMVSTGSLRSGQLRRKLRPLGTTYSVVAKRDGTIYAAGSGTRMIIFRPHDKFNLPWLKSSSDSPLEEGSVSSFQIHDSLIAMFGRPDTVFASSADRLSRRAFVLNVAWKKDRKLEQLTRNELKEAKKTLIKHKDTHKKVGAATKELEKSLIDADEMRQASRIATRIAIVALLIYLIQIVFNRYRYLQRISGFYRARAQAMRILASSAKLSGSMMVDVSAPDLMAALSPDAIGFDKSGEPPGQNLMSVMLGILRRDKKP